MKLLVKYSKDFGRSGVVYGLFICEADDLQKIVDYGTISFGDILGKHSDISMWFTLKDFVIVTNDQDFINKMVSYIGKYSISGYNPLDYMSQK